MKQNALITGASSGIGKSLAHTFAKNNYDLIIVAERSEELLQTARELRDQYSVEVIEIPKNLTDENAPYELYSQLQEQKIQVDVLVNNAGEGQKEEFHNSDINKDIYILRLNVEALLRLTKLFIRDMVDRNKGKILNVGSVASFQPGPLLAVYHASKAFVLSFSEAISKELKDTDVTVTVLCPGPTDTKFFKKADMENARILEDGIVMDPDEVAQAGFDALMNDERVIIPGFSNKLLTFTRRLIPKSLQASLHEKFYEVKENN